MTTPVLTPPTETETGRPEPQEPTTHHVRSDLRVGVLVIAVAIAGRIAWEVVDTGAAGLIPWT